jgi:hypothetical protein
MSSFASSAVRRSEQAGQESASASTVGSNIGPLRRKPPTIAATESRPVSFLA